MKIVVETIPEEGQQLSFQVLPSQLEEIAKDWRLIGTIQADLDLFSQGSRDSGEVYVSASVSARIECECSRCLKQFPLSIASDFNLLYSPKLEALPEGECRLSDGELDLLYYEGNQIDLDAELLSQLVLSIPMLPLCEGDCRGLCLQCGENLNLVACACKDEETNSTWAGLKNFCNKEFHAESKT